MPHETSLLATIAVSLSFAFVGGYIAARLKLPPLVGYLIAGMAVGPFTPGFVADARLAPQLAEIGVIFLLFGVGMHFSLNDLWAVRHIALPGAVVQIAIATGLGAGAAWFWNWPVGACLVFGIALSVASTVVLLRALEETESLHTTEGRIAVGWLVVEDLATVLALVLLPDLLHRTAVPVGGFSLGNSAGILAAFPWAAIAVTIGKIMLFAVFVLIFGTRLFPRLLKHVERIGSQELFTLAVIVLSLGVAFGSARLFGVSYALGAFFAGVMIHGSDVSSRTAANLQPLEDAFGALFFVGVGMLFDPAIVAHEPWRLLVVLAIVVLGKSLGALGIVLALGHPMRTALTVAAGLAQIGEFSFILAELGVVLGLLPAEGQHLIVAGALVSIAINPILFRAVGKLHLPSANPIAVHRT